MHGKVSSLHANGEGLFAGLPCEFPVTRYHSLVVQEDTLPPFLQVDAHTEDGAVMAQLGIPDMKIPISLALNYPQRLSNDMPSLDLAEAGALHFEKPDTDSFVCLRLAYEALSAGGTFCAALNAANEVCVEAFLKNRISYWQIGDTLQRIMDMHRPSPGTELEEILAVDAMVRKQTEALIHP